jgi:hypothetical protein
VEEDVELKVVELSAELEDEVEVIPVDVLGCDENKTRLAPIAMMTMTTAIAIRTISIPIAPLRGSTLNL